MNNETMSVYEIIIILLCFVLIENTYAQTSGAKEMIEAMVNEINIEIEELRGHDVDMQRTLENITKQFIHDTTVLQQNINRVENLARVHNSNKRKRLILNGVQYPAPFVAFDVYLTQAQQNVGNTEKNILYDHIQTNVMNGYNGTNGVFIAPITGVYFFSWTTQIEYGASVVTKLYVNGNVIAVSHADSIHQYTNSFHASATKNAILEINKGDRIYITMKADRGFVISNKDVTSSFEGTILYTCTV